MTFPIPEDYDRVNADIEGLIFQINDVWVCCFYVDGEEHRCRIDYNPWTGEKLK